MQNHEQTHCENCGAPGWCVIEVNYDRDGSVNTVYGCQECGFEMQYNSAMDNELRERLWSDWQEDGCQEGDEPE